MFETLIFWPFVDVTIDGVIIDGVTVFLDVYIWFDILPLLGLMLKGTDCLCEDRAYGWLDCGYLSKGSIKSCFRLVGVVDWMFCWNELKLTVGEYLEGECWEYLGKLEGDWNDILVTVSWLI